VNIYSFNHQKQLIKGTKLIIQSTFRKKASKTKQEKIAAIPKHDTQQNKHIHYKHKTKPNKPNILGS